MKKSTKAFAMLEILLVIAAIVILAGIIILAVKPTQELTEMQEANNSENDSILEVDDESSIDENSDEANSNESSLDEPLMNTESEVLINTESEILIEENIID